MSNFHLLGSKFLTNNLQISPTANIHVNWDNGFNNNPQAKAAFQYAVDIWQTLITSPVTIELDAHWQSSGTNILGQATPNHFLKNFSGAQVNNTYYPSALANALAGHDLSPEKNDIYVQLNSDINWYFGREETPFKQENFISVALHEIAHGLGFTSWFDFNINNKNGKWGYGDDPYIFDRFVVNATGQNPIDTNLFPNNSVALGTQLINNRVFFSGINANAINGGSPKLYAPSLWQGGASIAHLDERSYDNSINALMTPSSSGSEQIGEQIGPIAFAIFQDLGWKMNTNGWIYGTVGNDTLNGDVLDGQPISQKLYGWDGTDKINSAGGNDFADGGNGNDTVRGEAGNDTLYGGLDDDLLSGGIDNDVLSGGAGNDTLRGGDGRDFLYGDLDNDVLNGGAGKDTLRGGDGGDLLYGGMDNDVLSGGAGNDTLRGGDSRDTLYGGKGRDFLFGGIGIAQDLLLGQADDDTLKGYDGDDILVGGTGEDRLVGGKGNDTLIGGNAMVATRSIDELTVETIEPFDSDRDVFVFTQDDSFQSPEIVVKSIQDDSGEILTTVETKYNIDVIEGFDVQNDVIELRFDFSEALTTSDRQYDYFKEAMTKGLQSSFFQDGADTYIGSREESNNGLGSIGVGINQSYLVIKNVEIGNLNSNNFRFVDTNP